MNYIGCIKNKNLIISQHANSFCSTDLNLDKNKIVFITNIGYLYGKNNNVIKKNIFFIYKLSIKRKDN